MSHHVFAVTAETQDLDVKLTEALGPMSVDLEGQLVRSLALRPIFKLFDEAFNSFTAEWLERCNVNDICEFHVNTVGKADCMYHS